MIKEEEEEEVFPPPPFFWLEDDMVGNVQHVLYLLLHLLLVPLPLLPFLMVS